MNNLEILPKKIWHILFILGRFVLLKLNSKKHISIKMAKIEVRKGDDPLMAIK